MNTHNSLQEFVLVAGEFVPQSSFLYLIEYEVSNTKVSGLIPRSNILIIHTEKSS